MEAQKFAESIQYDIEDHDEGGYLGINTRVLAEKLIEFAEYHKNKALKSATRVLDVDNDGDYIKFPTDEAILNSYPSENIK